MSEPFLGEIRPFSFGFAPRGWAYCDGTLLSISQNQALFSLLGTSYGGNGVTTFTLPNLQGRAPIGWGQGPGLENYVQGEVGGAATVTLAVAELPAHSHTANAVGGAGDRRDPFEVQPPAGHRWAASGHPQYSTAPTPGVNLAPAVIAAVGGSQPHANESPFLTLLYCIALTGIYPSRP